MDNDKIIISVENIAHVLDIKEAMSAFKDFSEKIKQYTNALIKNNPMDAYKLLFSISNKHFYLFRHELCTHDPKKIKIFKDYDNGTKNFIAKYGISTYATMVANTTFIYGQNSSSDLSDEEYYDDWTFVSCQ
jgi:hypothetical protein